MPQRHISPSLPERDGECFSHMLVIESLFLARVNEDVMLMVIESIGVEKT